MSPPTALLLVLLSLALAAPSAADPQLDAVNENFDRKLSDWSDERLSGFASAALDRQMERIASRRGDHARPAGAQSAGSPTRCAVLPDATLGCTLVSARSESPPVDELAVTRP